MSSQPRQLLPSECLPVDVFYSIARYLPSMDIMRLAQADPALTEVAEHYMSLRPVDVYLDRAANSTEVYSYLDDVAPFARHISMTDCHLYLDRAANSPDVYSYLDAVAAFARHISMTVCHPSWHNQLMAFLAKCAVVEKLEIYGFLRLQNTTFQGFENVQQLKLTRMDWESAVAVCQLCNTDNLRIVHLERIVKYMTRCLWVLPSKIHELQLNLIIQHFECVLPPLRAYLTANPHLQALNLEYINHKVSIDLSTLTDQLQELRTLRLHYCTRPCLQNCAALTALPKLVTLDVHFAQPELIEYLMALTSGDATQSPVQDLCIRIANDVDCAAVPWHRLAALAQLEHLAISNRARLCYEAALRCGLSNLPQLRTLKLINWPQYSPFICVTADWLVESFPLLESLSVELLPAAMSRLAELPNLRRLHLIPETDWHSGKKVRRKQQNAEVGRLLMALSQHKELRQLAIIPRHWDTVRLGDYHRMGEWRHLQKINVSRLLGPRDLMQLSEQLAKKRIRCTMHEDVHAEPGFWNRAVELTM